MQIKRINYLFATFIVVFSFVALGNFVNAEGVGIKITPTKIDELVEPGQTFTSYLKITNQSDASKKMYPFLRDFSADGESGSVKFYIPGVESGSFLASWIEISNDGFDFAPREEKTIPFTIKVPKNTGPGGYYGAILFGPKPSEINISSEDKGAGMSIVNQVSCLILFQVKGDVNENARIKEFITDKERYNIPFEVEFSAKIENLGNVHIKPQGSIEIKNWLGKEVANIVFNDAGANVMPKTNRKMIHTWKDEMGFGRYKATLGLTYGTSPRDGGGGMHTLYSEKYFWIIPLKIVSYVLGTFFILLVLFVLFIKIYKNKAIKKAMKRAGVSYGGKKVKSSGAGQFSLAMFMVFIILFFILVGLYFLLFA